MIAHANNLMRDCMHRQRIRCLIVVFPLITLQGCIYTQNGFIRNDSDGTVFVGDPAQSSFSKIESSETIEKRFLYCLEVASFESSRYYGVPQVSEGIYFSDGTPYRLDSPTSEIPPDAYQDGGRFDDVSLVYTDDGLFFDSATQGLVPVAESVRCAESDAVLME